MLEVETPVWPVPDGTDDVFPLMAIPEFVFVMMSRGLMLVLFSLDPYFDGQWLFSGKGDSTYTCTGRRLLVWWSCRLLLEVRVKRRDWPCAMVSDNQGFWTQWYDCFVRIDGGFCCGVLSADLQLSHRHVIRAAIQITRMRCLSRALSFLFRRRAFRLCLCEASENG
jgi:hypothetical protein